MTRRKSSKNHAVYEIVQNSIWLERGIEEEENPPSRNSYHVNLGNRSGDRCKEPWHQHQLLLQHLRLLF
jgi:hypothetical protein